MPLLALQFTTEAPPFDLSILPKADARCSEAAAGGEIVVCGHRDTDRYRLRPLPPGDFAEKPVRAETRLGSGAIGVTTEQASIGGVKSNRAMVRFRLKF